MATIDFGQSSFTVPLAFAVVNFTTSSSTNQDQQPQKGLSEETTILRLNLKDQLQTKLPLEIREMIWSFVVVSPDREGRLMFYGYSNIYRIKTGALDLKIDTKLLPMFCNRRSLAIARTCKQIHNEAERVYFQQNIFCFDGLYSLLMFLALIGCENRKWVKVIEVQWEPDFLVNRLILQELFEKLWGHLKDCIRLKKLHICVSWATKGSGPKRNDLFRGTGFNELLLTVKTLPKLESIKIREDHIRYETYYRLPTSIRPPIKATPFDTSLELHVPTANFGPRQFPVEMVIEVEDLFNRVIKKDQAAILLAYEKFGKGPPTRVVQKRQARIAGEEGRRKAESLDGNLEKNTPYLIASSNRFKEAMDIQRAFVFYRLIRAHPEDWKWR